MRRRLARAWPYAALGMLAVLYYADFLTGRVFLWEDGLKSYYPAARYFCRALWSGSLPLWAPGLSCGFPFYADPQSGVFYPLNWLLLPFAREGLSFLVYQRLLVLEIVLGGGLCLAFLRSLRLRPLAALCGALVFAFSGFMSLHFKHVAMVQAYIWLPLSLLLVRRLARGFSGGAFAALAAALSLSLLGGHTQISVYGFLAAGLYWLFCLRERGRLTVRAAAGAAGAFALTAALNAYLILPAYAGFAASWRGGWDERQAVDQSLPVYHLAALAAPNIFGSTEDRPAAVPYWGFDRASRLVREKGGGDWQYWEFGAYAGQAALLALLGVVLGLKNLRRRRQAAFFAALWLFGVGYMLGRHAGLAPLLCRVLPLLAKFRVPARMAMAVDLSFAVLTAVFVDALEGGERPMVLLPAAALAAAYAALRLGLAHAGVAGERLAHAGVCLSASLGILALTAAFAWAARSAHAPRARRLLLWALVLFLFGDLYSGYGSFHRGTVSPDVYYADQARMAEKLAAEKEPVRLAQAVDGRSRSDVLLMHNFPLVSPGVDLAEGDTTFNRADLEAFHGLADQGARLDIQNVAVLAELDTKRARLSIDRRKGYLPRAKFYARTRAFAARGELLKALDGKSLDYRAEAGVLSADRAAFDGRLSPDDKLAYRRLGPGAYAVDYDVAEPGVVFVSESYDPGWRVEGPARLVEVFGAFQGLVLDKPGRGSLTVRFRPALFREGLLVSALALVLTCALALRRREAPSLP